MEVHRPILDPEQIIRSPARHRPENNVSEMSKRDWPLWFVLLVVRKNWLIGASRENSPCGKSLTHWLGQGSTRSKLYFYSLIDNLANHHSCCSNRKDSLIGASCETLPVQTQVLAVRVDFAIPAPKSPIVVVGRAWAPGTYTPLSSTVTPDVR